MRAVIFTVAAVVATLTLLTLGLLELAVGRERTAPAHRPAAATSITTSSSTSSSSWSSTTAPPAPGPARASRSAPTAAPRAATPPRSGRAVGPSDASLDALAGCESGRNPRAVGSEVVRGRRMWFYGAFQFTLGTWRSLGYAGNPTEYSYETQRAAAGQLIARSGWGQFPVCARKLGMR